MPKSILITGCSAHGIGSALALALHARGHGVIASARTIDDVDPILTAQGMTPLALDVTDAQSIADAVAVVRMHAPALDMLVNNAGVLEIMPFADTSLDAARRVLDVNLFGAWAVTAAFLPLLLESENAVVATLGSVNEVLCPPFLAAYNASKAAVEALMRTLRRELAPLGVRVVLLKTGSVRTALFDNAAPSVLPADSLYAPIAECIAKRRFLEGGRFVAAAAFAEEVADELLRDNVRPVIWKGGLAWLAWFLSWFGWETMMVSYAMLASKCHVLTDRTMPSSRMRSWTSYGTSHGRCSRKPLLLH